MLPSLAPIDELQGEHGPDTLPEGLLLASPEGIVSRRRRVEIAVDLNRLAS